MKLEYRVANQLISQNKTLAIAESCTGGYLSNKLTNISGSSKFFKVGLITYSNESKIKLLKVPKRIILSHGAVSKQTATAMASGAQKIFDTDIGISITGIAGPTGDSIKKPVGLVYIAIKTKKDSKCKKFIFKGSRAQIKSHASKKALEMILIFSK